MEIRVAKASDRAAIRDVVLSAFAEEPQVAELVDELHRNGRARHELVAVDGGRVIGHVLLSRGWVDDPAELAEVLVLSPLGVLADEQGRGVGTALLEAALDTAREAGESLVFLEGDPRYYGRRGFVPAWPLGFLAPSDRVPAPAFQVAVVGDSQHRGRLVYADSFWAYDCVGLRGEALTSVRKMLED